MYGTVFGPQFSFYFATCSLLFDYQIMRYVWSIMQWQCNTQLWPMPDWCLILQYDSSIMPADTSIMLSYIPGVIMTVLLCNATCIMALWLFNYAILHVIMQSGWSIMTGQLCQTNYPTRWRCDRLIWHVE